jgi:hypothetical protein
MKIHVQFARSKLVVLKKLAIIEELVDVNHNQQLGKK